MSNSILVSKEVCASISAANPHHCSLCTAAGQVMIAYSISNEWTLQGSGYIDLSMDQNQNLFIILYSSNNYRNIYQFQLYPNFYKHYKKTSDTFYNFDSGSDYLIGLSFSSSEEAKNFQTAVINLSKHYCKKKLFSRNLKNSDKVQADLPLEIESPLDECLSSRGYNEDDLKEGKIDRGTLMEILKEADQHSDLYGSENPAPQSLPVTRPLLDSPEILSPSIFSPITPKDSPLLNTPANKPQLKPSTFIPEESFSSNEPPKSPPASPIIQSNKSADKSEAEYSVSAAFSKFQAAAGSNKTINSNSIKPPTNSTIDKSTTNASTKMNDENPSNDAYSVKAAFSKFKAAANTYKQPNNTSNNKVNADKDQTENYSVSAAFKKFQSTAGSINNSKKSPTADQSSIDCSNYSSLPNAYSTANESKNSKSSAISSRIKFFNSFDVNSSGNAVGENINLSLLVQPKDNVIDDEIKKDVELDTNNAIDNNNTNGTDVANNIVISNNNINDNDTNDNDIKDTSLNNDNVNIDNNNTNDDNEIDNQNENDNTNDDNITGNDNETIIKNDGDNFDSHIQKPNDQIANSHTVKINDDYENDIFKPDEDKINKDDSQIFKTDSEHRKLRTNRSQRGRANSTVVIKNGLFFINNFQVKPPPKVKPPPPSTPPPITARRIPKIGSTKETKNCPLPIKPKPSSMDNNNEIA